ncbi:hypothetical protein [Cellulosimicrobium sp. Marseille-Q4280]|uniref:hypothetical protein n=1 Tax=Cellulosimicrobium sp. Marseille-Q4280 TaxID=2937992 RepID=UPI002040A1FC|nr:hypothetical protein [Cellulosimicrobium sp. Marseille-Q4280]
MSEKVTSGQVLTAVRAHFGAEHDTVSPEWAALDELTDAPGYAASRRADLFLVRAWNGRRGHERILVEVKVSRADLRAELARPEKMDQIGRYAHRLYFAAPAALVRPEDDLGAGVGLLEVGEHGRVREVRKAARRDPQPVPPEMFVETFRRAARAEARIRAEDDGDPAATIVALRKQLASANAAADRARQAAATERARMVTFENLVLASGAIPCTCGAELRTPKRRSHWDRTHADGSPCPERYGAGPDLDVMRARFDAVLTPSGASDSHERP